MTAQQRKKPVSKKPAKNAAKSSASKAKKGTKRANTAASRDAVGTVLANHRADVWGVGALLFGLLTAFAVWLGSAGFIGDVLDDGLALGVGLTRAIVPLALIGVGGLLIMGGDVDESDVERTARVTIGGLFTLVSTTGLLHVLRGRPGLDDPIEEVGAAGGALGMAVGGPLHALADGAGAAVILLAIGVIGVIIVTGSSARAVGRVVGRGLAPVPGGGIGGSSGSAKRFSRNNCHVRKGRRPIHPDESIQVPGERHRHERPHQLPRTVLECP